MSKIHVLNPDISNKIAAGEVVERPASVIKELMENAVDAGADLITVEIKNGGISYIRLTDNGNGMSEEDAKMAFLRHATSKIATSDDLERISTLGFRGEALASIAAVSKVELMTKSDGCEGVYLELDGGEVISSQPAGCPKGTTIVVKDLFYNTPARMKFLKSDKTETGYITDIVQRLILSNPNVSVKYIVDGKERLFFSGDGKLTSCVYSIYGREYAKACVEIQRYENNINISGLIGKAEISRGNRRFQSFFINGRYIKNHALTYAAEAAYSNTLMTGRFPFFVIHINLPYELVDINVHPTKQEVKFSNERMVCDQVYWAVKTALASAADEVRKSFTPPAKPSLIAPALSEPVKQLGMSMPIPPPVKTTLDTANMMAEPYEPIAREDDHADGQEEISYRIVGQLFDTYIIIELDEKIVLIDQHAAHERMIYEKLLKAKREKKPIGQILLSPVAVTLSPDEFEFVAENAEEFFRLGFDFEEFGNNAILVRQTPVNIGEDGVKALILELIQKMQASTAAMPGKEEEIIETISCKAAVKGKSSLHSLEIKALIEDVIRTGGVNTCPHGRPLMISITKYELEKMFKRIV
jgi:DNA mismatch repair protein MutL